MTSCRGGGLSASNPRPPPARAGGAPGGRRVLRGMYRRLAADVAGAAPEGGAVLDVGTGPGVLLVELAVRRPDLQLTGIDLSADMITAATRNLRPFEDRASASVGDVTRLP